MDNDADGVADATPVGADTDMDGLDDAFDPDCSAATCGGVDGQPAPTPDFDGDMRPDFLDIDSDDDGILDASEAEGATADRDADGSPDYLDLDTDGDGVPDLTKATTPTLMVHPM